MNRSVFPRFDTGIVSDDGDQLHFCSTCAFSDACISQGMDKSALMDLHVLVNHVGPLKGGDVIFRQGQPFSSIAAVRAGAVKTFVTDREGNEQVLGFYLPGEVIGLSGVDTEHYPCSAVALDTTMLCNFSFEQIEVLAARVPGLQRQLFRLLSRDVGKAITYASGEQADVRIGAFLLNFSRRLEGRGFSGKRFQLLMPRVDIANYLRLTPETVSRVMRKLQDEGVLQLDRRQVEILDMPKLEQLAAPLITPR